MFKTSTILLLLALTTCTFGQDFHFISTRDSGAGELNYEIYRYQNGTQTRITNTPVIEEHPIFSGVNNTVFAVGPSPTGSEIITIDPILGFVNPITFDTQDPFVLSNSHPFLHPNEQSLFVTTHLLDGTSLIREIDLSGNEMAVVVSEGCQSGHSPTANTPSGPKLYYTSNADGDFEIYRCDLNGANKEQLTSTALHCGGAVPSPNGQQVAFCMVDPFDQWTTHLFVMDHDGQNLQPVTNPAIPGYKWPFGWDGNQVLYTSNENGSNEIFAIGANGAGQNLLVTSPGHDQHLLPDALCGVPGPQPRLTLPQTPVAPLGQPVPLEWHDMICGHDLSSFNHTIFLGNQPPLQGVGNQAVHAFNQPGPNYVAVTVEDPLCPNFPWVFDLFLDVFPIQFPGTGDDLILATGVSGNPVDEHPFKIIFPNEPLDLFYDSPFGTFHGDFPIVAGQFFNPGLPPIGGFPGLHLSQFGQPPFILVDGAQPLGPLGPQPILPGGNLHTFLTPPGLAGNDLMLQAVVLDPGANNGIFGASDGKVISFN